MSYTIQFTMQSPDGRQVIKVVDWSDLKHANHNIPHHIIQELELELENDTKTVGQKPQ